MQRVQWDAMQSLFELIRTVEAGKQECLKQGKQLLLVGGVPAKKIERLLSPVNAGSDDDVEPAEDEAAQ